jgi:site-specific DNA recombinase
MSERVAIYSRKSNEQHGSAETRSIAMQVGHARTRAAAQGWTVVGPAYLYEDDDISGKEFVRRLGLQRLMRDIDSAPQPPFDILMTMDESRLGRDLFEAGANLKRIVESGVRVYFYGEQRFANLSDATNCIMTAVRLGGAQMEQEKAAERVTHTMHRKFELGHVCGGNVYGYRRVAMPLAAPDPTGKRRWSHVVLAIDAREAAQVVRIFELAAEGKGYGAIARLLTQEGVPSPSQRNEERHRAQGKVRDYSWGEAVVRQILHRKLYIGIAEYGKTKRGYKKGTAVTTKRPEREWKTRACPELRVVSDEVWTRAHARLAATRSYYLRTQGERRDGRPELDNPYLLSGFTACADCGRPLLVKKSGDQAHYKCSGNHRGKSVCSNGASFPVTTANEAVLNALLDEVLEHGAIIRALDRAVQQAVEEVGSPETQRLERDRLGEELRKVDGQLANLVAGLATMGGSVTVLEAIKQGEQRKMELQAALNRLQAAVPTLTPEDKAALEEGLRKLCDDWHHYFLSPDAIPACRQILKSVLRGRLHFKMLGRGAATFTGDVVVDGVFNAARRNLSLTGELEGKPTPNGHNPVRPPSETSPQKPGCPGKARARSGTSNGRRSVTGVATHRDGLPGLVGLPA